MDATEICIFWGDWQIQQWWSCMTKSEWSGWMQAIFSVAAIFSSLGIAVWLVHIERNRFRKHAMQNAALFAINVSGAMAGLLNCETPEAVQSIHAILEDTVALGQSIRTEELPLDVVMAVNGLRNISRQALNSLARKLDSETFEIQDVIKSFRFWGERTSIHTSVINSNLPKK